MIKENNNSATGNHVPVLIVGAGGAGLSMSLLLLQQGITSLLIERRSDISWVPRARNLNFRSLEVFRGLGLESEIHNAGSTVSLMFRKESLASVDRELLLDPASLVEHPEEFSPDPFIWYCPQSRLEPLLLAEARRRGGDVRYDAELISFIQDKTGVTTTIKDRSTGKLYDQRSDYLIAADGARSQVREMLNIPTQGLGEIPEHYIFVYFRADWSELVSGHESDGILIVNKDVRGIMLVTDKDRGMFMIMYSASPQDPTQDYTSERCKILILSAIGKPDMPVEIIEVTPWQPVQRVADRFRAERVFLVGDSAHTMPPKMGLGVNTAIQSAQNLAWKLAAVLKGNAGSALLATYQTERHPVGLLAAEQSLAGPAAALLENEVKGSVPESLKKRIPILQPIIGYCYRSDAIVSDERALLLPDSTSFPDRPELNGLPGTRVPHMWVEHQGKRISTLDLLDGRFVLFTGTGGAAWCEAGLTTAADMGIGLAIYRIGADADLVDVDNGWQTKMGVSTEGAVLVRPDGFVAWRSVNMPASPLQQLETILARILAIEVGIPVN
jgi:putative polyketide hydroxylase